MGEGYLRNKEEIRTGPWNLQVLALRTGFPKAVVETLPLGIKAILTSIAGAPEVHDTLVGGGVIAPLEQSLSAHIRLQRFDAPLCVLGTFYYHLEDL